MNQNSQTLLTKDTFADLEAKLGSVNQSLATLNEIVGEIISRGLSPLLLTDKTWWNQRFERLLESLNRNKENMLSSSASILNIANEFQNRLDDMEYTLRSLQGKQSQTTETGL